MSLTPQPLPHPRALAFLGDAVYELFLRKIAIAKGLSQSRDLHQFTTQHARADAQVALLHLLKPHLSVEEMERIRQGRNLGVGTGRRSGQGAHRLATGFEVLVGALYLTDKERLKALWDLIQPLIESNQLEANAESEQAADGIPDGFEEVADPAE